MKNYGLTAAQKRRKEKYEREEYEKLPWHIPMTHWEGWELNILYRHNTRSAMRWLAAVEDRIIKEQTKQQNI